MRLVGSAPRKAALAGVGLCGDAAWPSGGVVAGGLADVIGRRIGSESAEKQGGCEKEEFTGSVCFHFGHR